MLLVLGLPDEARSNEILNGHTYGFEYDAPAVGDERCRVGEQVSDLGLHLCAGKTDVARFAFHGLARLGYHPTALRSFVIEFAELSADGTDGEDESVGLEPAALQNGSGRGGHGEDDVGGGGFFCGGSTNMWVPQSLP